jgi:hypothetical protein
MTPWQKKLLGAVAREQVEGRGFILPLHLDLASLLSLVGNLQLALRHPANKGPSALIARELVDSIQKRLIDAGYFAHAEVVEIGNNPAFDGEPEKVSGGSH